MKVKILQSNRFIKKIILIFVLTIFIFACGYEEPVILATGKIYNVEYKVTWCSTTTIITLDNGGTFIVPQMIQIPDKTNQYSLVYERCRKNKDFDKYYFIKK